MNNVYLKNKRLLHNYLVDKGVPINTNKPMLNDLFSFYIKDKLHYSLSMPAFIKDINEHLKDAEKFCEKKSQVKGAIGYLFFLKDTVVDKVEGVTDDVVSDSPIVEKETAKEADWEWIDTLENKKEDKVLLDNYAADEFDIKLNKANTLNNMIKSFKEQLEA